MVNAQKLHREVKRLESKKDFILKSRDFSNLADVLDELDRVKSELAYIDPDWAAANGMRKFKQMIKL